MVVNIEEQNLGNEVFANDAYFEDEAGTLRRDRISL